jgi:hypothetical protein
LRCSAPRHGIFPPLRPGDIGRSLTLAWQTLWDVAAFKGLDINMGYSLGGLYASRIFEDMTRTTLMPAAETLELRGHLVAKLRGQADVAVVSDEGGATASQIQQAAEKSPALGTSLLTFDLRTDCRRPGCAMVVRDEGGLIGRIPLSELTTRRVVSTPKMKVAIVGSRDSESGPYLPGPRRLKALFAALRRVGTVYQALGPWIAAASMAAFFISLFFNLRRGAPSALNLINTVLLAMIASRLVILSYLKVAMAPMALSTLYLTPAYPLLLLFCSLSLIDLAQLGKDPSAR